MLCSRLVRKFKRIIIFSHVSLGKLINFLITVEKLIYILKRYLVIDIDNIHPDFALYLVRARQKNE